MCTNQEILVEEITQLRNIIEKGERNYSGRFIRECRNIELALVSKEHCPKSLVNIKYKIIKLKKKIDSYNEHKINKNSSILVYLIWGLEILLLIFKSSPPKSNFDYNIQNMFALIFLGILGATTYIYIKGTKETETFIYRMALSAIFPIIFLNIFTIKENSISGIMIINLIVFIGGYSSEFIFSVLNKLVEKAMEVTGLTAPKGINEPKEGSFNSRNAAKEE